METGVVTDQRDALAPDAEVTLDEPMPHGILARHGAAMARHARDDPRSIEDLALRVQLLSGATEK